MKFFQVMRKKLLIFDLLEVGWKLLDLFSAFIELIIDYMVLLAKFAVILIEQHNSIFQFLFILLKCKHLTSIITTGISSSFFL